MILLSAALAAVVVSLMTPTYRSTNTVLIEGGKNKVVSIEELYGVAAGSREFFQTQAEFMKSREVGLRVVRNEQLVNEPFFDARQKVKAGVLYNLVSSLNEYAWFRESVAPWLREHGIANYDDPVEKLYTWEELEEIALARLRDSTDIVPVRLSQLIEIRVESADRDLAARLANAMAEAYIRADLDARFEMQQKASTWLNERLSRLRETLEESEASLQAYREEIGLIATPNSSMGGTVRQLDTASDRLIQARVAFAEARQVYEQVRPGRSNRFQVPEVFNNESVATARLQVTAAQKQVTELSQSLGSAHPQLLAAREELAAAQQNLERQSENVVASIAKRYEVARSTLQAVEQELAGSRESIQEINRKEGRLNVLQRDVATNQQIYETFLSRVKETDATADFRTPIARVVDSAVPGLQPVKPPKSQIVLLAALLGGLLGALLAIALEQRRTVIRATEEVDTKLGLPLLAAAPLVPRDEQKAIATLQHSKPTSLFSEAVRTAATSVQFSTMDLGTPVIVVTSTMPEEGKTTVAMNLAIEQARTHKTLLIDADMRKPSVARRLGVSQEKLGLSELLGGAPLASCTQVVKDFDLSVILTGELPPNPRDLLMRREFGELLDRLKGVYECIVIDTPPIELVSDALPLARESSGVVYVVRAGATPVPMIRRGIERFVTANVRMLGVFLNGHDFRRASRYYGEYSAYGGGYGYGYRGYRGGYGYGGRGPAYGTRGEPGMRPPPRVEDSAPS